MQSTASAIITRTVNPAQVGAGGITGFHPKGRDLGLFIGKHERKLEMIGAILRRRRLLAATPAGDQDQSPLLK